MRVCVAFLAGMLALAIFPARAIENDSVTTYHGDSGRSGHFVVPALSWERARLLRLDRTFDARVAGPLYAQSLYWRPTDSDRGILFVATENDVVQAIDATNGKELWRREVGDPVRSGSLPCGNIKPLGITGTPVIDAKSQAIYFDAAVGLVEIYSLALCVDDRRPRNSKRLDVSAWQRPTPHWIANLASPQFLAVCRVNGLDNIVLSRHKQDSP